MLRVSVVVPILNAARTLPSCLAAIERLDPQPLEILFVDNGSTDGSLTLLHTFEQAHAGARIRVLTERTRGPSAARNTGVHASQGEIIAFTDADCVPAPDWLHDLMDAFTDETISAVAGNILGYQPSKLLEKFQSLFTLRADLNQEQIFDRYTLTTGGFPTANLAVRKKTLEEIGGFDESLEIYGEDHDLCRRIYGVGGWIKAIPCGTVFHIHRSTILRFLQQNFGFGRGHAQILARCFKQFWQIQFADEILQSKVLPGKVWVDLNLLDKKIGLLVATGIMWPPIWVISALYLWHLSRQAGQRAIAAGMVTTWPERLAMVGLFFLKCLAIDCGRWYGSLRYRVLCM